MRLASWRESEWLDVVGVRGVLVLVLVVAFFVYHVRGLCVSSGSGFCLFGISTAAVICVLGFWYVGMDRRSSPNPCPFCSSRTIPSSVACSSSCFYCCSPHYRFLGYVVRFLEAKASATVLLSEARALVKFVDMNMHAFRCVCNDRRRREYKLRTWSKCVAGRQQFVYIYIFF